MKHEDNLWDKTLAVSTERVGESYIEVVAEKASVAGRERHGVSLDTQRIRYSQKDVEQIVSETNR